MLIRDMPLRQTARLKKSARAGTTIGVVGRSYTFCVTYLMENLMTTDDLAAIYRDCISCLNTKDWASLGRFVHEEVRHNGRRLALQDNRGMIEDDFERIPDLNFDIQILVSEPPRIASRLLFDVTPTGEFLGLPVNGRRVIFCENVFCNFQDQRIQEVGRIDKAAIEI
jgi:predicted ester cyclase